MSDPLNIRIGSVTNAGTAVNLDTDRVKSGEWWSVNHIGLMNRTGEAVTMLLYLVTGSEADQIWAKQSVSDGDAIGVLLALTVGEGQQVRAAVTGTANKAAIELVVMGTREYLETD
jgi:threonine/homoserine efflux transporter RhtA